MSEGGYYRQCQLVRKVEGKDANEFTTSWIPERFAKKGNVCELYIKDAYQDGWWIERVGDTRLTNMQVNDKSRANKDFTHSIKN